MTNNIFRKLVVIVTKPLNLKVCGEMKGLNISSGWERGVGIGRGAKGQKLYFLRKVSE